MVRASSSTAKLDELGIEKVVADSMQPASLPPLFAARRFDAVVSLIGTSARDLPQRRNPIDATRAAGVRRFVFVTVIGAGDSDGAVPWGGSPPATQPC
jgi:uncharacterized protein YbjT (DUF2867 family)